MGGWSPLDSTSSLTGSAQFGPARAAFWRLSVPYHLRARITINKRLIGGAGAAAAHAGMSYMRTRRIREPNGIPAEPRHNEGGLTGGGVDGSGTDGYSDWITNMISSMIRTHQGAGYGYT